MVPNFLPPRSMAVIDKQNKHLIYWLVFCREMIKPYDLTKRLT